MRRGFTLVELMVALSILGVLATLAVANGSSAYRRGTIAETAAELRRRVDRVRNLSVAAGSRLGTSRLALGPSCQTPGAQQLRIETDGFTVSLPAAIEIDPATDIATVQCESLDIQAMTDGQAVLSPVPRPLAFTATGRLVHDQAQAYLRIVALGGAGQRAFRVLASGVTCYTSEPPPATGCDREEQ
ncbi:MAG: type II secretion system protein [Deltaproteobacteria bacterium]